MTLQHKLDDFKSNFESSQPATTIEIMHRATRELKESGIVENAVKRGDTLPDFSLPNHAGEIITLSSLLQKGPAVMVWFRGVWCPYCMMEINAINDAYEQFREAGVEVVAVAPQQADFAAETVSKHNLKFDVLVDEHNHLADELGLSFTLPGDLREVYQSFGIDLVEYNGDEDWKLPVASRLIVMPDKTVFHIDKNADYTRRPDPSETLQHLEGALEATT